VEETRHAMSLKQGRDGIDGSSLADTSSGRSKDIQNQCTCSPSSLHTVVGGQRFSGAAVDKTGRCAYVDREFKGPPVRDRSLT